MLCAPRARVARALLPSRRALAVECFFVAACGTDCAPRGAGGAASYAQAVASAVVIASVAARPDTGVGALAVGLGEAAAVDVLRAEITSYEVGGDVHARRARVVADFLQFQAARDAAVRGADDPLGCTTPDHILAWLTHRASTAGRTGSDAAGRHWMAHSSVQNDLGALRDSLLTHFGVVPWDPRSRAGNPGLAPAVGQFMEGYRKRAAATGLLPRPAEPFSMARVLAMVGRLGDLVATQPRGSHARVVLSQTRVAVMCGFWWGDRAGDVLARRFEHVRVLPNATVEVTYYNDKSAKLSGKDVVKVKTYPLMADPALCPAWAMVELSLDMRAAGVVCDSGFMIRRLTRGGAGGAVVVDCAEPLPSGTLRSRFNALLRDVGVSPTGDGDGSFHGLRRGAAQHMHALGASPAAILAMGRWRNVASMLMYLRRSPAFVGAEGRAAAAAASGVGGASSAAAAGAAGAPLVARVAMPSSSA